MPARRGYTPLLAFKFETVPLPDLFTVKDHTSFQRLCHAVNPQAKPSRLLARRPQWPGSGKRRETVSASFQVIDPIRKIELSRRARGLCSWRTTETSLE